MSDSDNIMSDCDKLVLDKIHDLANDFRSKHYSTLLPEGVQQEIISK